MIAASDPQEFVPSGRQQAFKHPQPDAKRIGNEQSDLLLNKLERVSLVEGNNTEWWILRKTPNEHNNTSANYETYRDEDKSYFGCSHKEATSYLDDSLTSKSLDVGKSGKRMSDAGCSRQGNKRLSVDNDNKNESRFVSDSNKLNYGRASTKCFRTKLETGFMEDELYVRGNTTIWSRGLVTNEDEVDNGRQTICSYTSPLPVKQAFWCTFYCERPTYDPNLIDVHRKVDEPAGIPVPSICIIDEHNLRVFSEKGEDFVISVPFQIKKAWPTKFGIFIEKKADSVGKDNFYDCQSTIFSMAYPIDDICSLAVNCNNLIQILNNKNLSIVFTSEEPSICMVYNSQTKQHSVFRVRNIRPDERAFVEKSNNANNTKNPLTTSKQLKNKFSIWNIVNSSNIPASSLGHAHQTRSLNSMAAMSRCQSPSASIGSPWVGPKSRASFNTTERATSMPNNTFFDFSKIMSHLRSTPTVCLDYLWTDNYSVQDGALAGPATKVFLSEDFSGQWYLCYILLSRFQLSIVKIDFTSNYPNISFGMLTSISAKDAVPIPHLHMLAILEHNGNVTLYSGLTVIGKLHTGGTLVQHTPSPYIRKNCALLYSPFPRRSSLLPHCQPVDPKFDEHLLSPVLPAAPSQMPRSSQFNFEGTSRSVLSGLIDAIENRITLKYSDGTYYRITLPALASSSLVESVLNAFRQFLPRDALIVLMSRWYSTRNALGSQNLSLDQEWSMFTGLMYELIGYEDTTMTQDLSADLPATPASAVKRAKHDSQGSRDDWTMLTTSARYKIRSDMIKMLKLKVTELLFESEPDAEMPDIHINTKSVLFPYIRIIHFVLHLLYEDFKLNLLRCDEMLPLMVFLNKLSNDLELTEYSLHYWKDFPAEATLFTSSNIKECDLKNVNTFPGMSEKPINIMQHILNLLGEDEVEEYPYLAHVNERSRDIVQLVGILSGRHRHLPPESLRDSFVKDLISSHVENASHSHVRIGLNEASIVETAVLTMVDMGITPEYLDTLPVGINLLMYNALWKCRENPPSNWSAEAYYLLWREDLAAQTLKMKKESNEDPVSEKFRMHGNNQMPFVVPPADAEQPDGMEDIDTPLMRLRFADDVRVAETRKMLQSSRPIPIVLVQRPDVSDHDFIEEQEKHLFATCARTMALPVGRGMFTLRTSMPVITEPLPTPPLTLTGKVPPRGTTIDVSHIDTPPNMSLWPLFHNGVANGLRISPDSHYIDTTWIAFNMPKGNCDQQMEHAGFLMALGLNGHLRNLSLLSTYDYLTKLHEMTSVGVLLGWSASYRGTANTNLTKMLSVHVEALLPPTSMELDVPQNLQVAALFGIGLLYQRTAHCHIAEVLLSEIGRPPGPEMENSVDRESYSLAAGLALGLVTLKQGDKPAGLSDLNVPDTLHYYMVGGNKRPLTGSQKDKYKVSSFQIREGSSVNLDVTAPGATLALGLMYLGTGNKAVADWMAPPDTQYLLDFVRPDFLMLRILSRALIHWNDIEPSREWVEGQVPTTIRPYCMVKPSPTVDVDYEAMNQAYCNIVAGACFALGLKFAGSADEDAFETLLYFCHMFTKLTSKSIAELAGKPTIETCLNVLLLSAAMVMAGTGNLEIMRLVRHLRRRVGVTACAVVTYGSHLATHMALGLLFLGGGRYTLSNSPASIAALICAFYPKFPTHSNDNRYHLQAFRHLYVLAVQPRVIIPKDVHLGKSCYANLKIVKLDGSTTTVKAPGIIPDTNTLLKVSVDDERYWPVVFERGHNWDLLLKILSTNGEIEVKQRAGCLSYVVDKLGYHSQLARTLTQSGVVPWDPTPASIRSFTSDETIKHFCDHFFINPRSESEYQKQVIFRQRLMRVTYDAVIKDKLVIVYVLAAIFKMIDDFEGKSKTYNMWQIKIVVKQALMKSSIFDLIPKEAILAIQEETAQQMDADEPGIVGNLRNYLEGVDFVSFDVDYQRMIANYLVFYDLPFKLYHPKCENLLELMDKVKDHNLSSETIERIWKILKTYQ